MDALHITTAHKPTDTRIFDKQATSLAAAGFDVGILCPDAPNAKMNNVGFETFGSYNSRWGRWGSIPKAIKVAKRVNPSVYHFHDPELIPAGLYLSTMTDGKVIYDVHEDYGHVVSQREWIPSLLSKGLAKVFPEFEQRAASAQFDAIICATDWIANRFQDRGPRVEVVHNFPKTKTIDLTEGAVERDADVVLCYVGGIVSGRGIYRMIDTVGVLIERGVDAELWVLGDWRPDTDQAAVQNYIQHRGLDDYIVFTGYVDYDRMFEYLCSADIGLSLLDTEEFERAIPTKVFEYLYAGLPIVSTRLDAVSKYVPDLYCAMVSQGDAEETAHAVEQLIRADFDREEVRFTIENELNWENEAKTLVNVYEKLI
jgi:glycosyltransferase involved in cell wall biosynthesis